ncbi:unnamed protein product [Symbiodinium sp. CCMP2456]|nr:unnamed protein product [Symbiodinium sp. CCMP2456]
MLSASADVDIVFAPCCPPSPDNEYAERESVLSREVTTAQLRAPAQRAKTTRGVQNLEQTELQAAPAQGKYRRVSAGGDDLIAAQRIDLLAVEQGARKTQKTGTLVSPSPGEKAEKKDGMLHDLVPDLLDDEVKPDKEDGKIYLKRYGDLQKGFVLGQRDIVDPGGPAMHEPTVRCEGRCKILRLTRRDYLHCLKEMQVEKHRIVHALRNIPPSRPGEPHHRSEEQLSLLAKLVRNTPELKNFERPTLMQVLGAATYVNAGKGHVLCKQGEIGDQFYAIIATQEAVPGDLLGDDECLESSTCALNVLQMRGKAMEDVEEGRQMPWMMMPPHARWRMREYHPPPVMPPYMRPEPMGPMPYYSPESYMHPQPGTYMHPQPVEPTDMQPAQPAEEHPKMVTRQVKYLPLSAVGWGMIADDEGMQIRELTSNLKGCEGECTNDPQCHSFVFCMNGGCYLKTAQFHTGQEPVHYSGFCSTYWTPAVDTSQPSVRPTLPPVQHVEVKQCAKGQVPEPSGSCVASTAPELMTFYQYSAQKKQNVDDRVWENVNFANIGGVMFYLHNEVVDKAGEMRNAEGDRTPKFNIDRILRFKVTMKNPDALWKKYRSQFGQFIQFDYGQATFGMPNHVEKCNEIWETIGYEVGCQPNPTGISGYDGGYWTSWPGRCPSMPFSDKAPQGGYAKTAECMERQPGGSCGRPDGGATCTWHIEPAGFILLDDLVGQNLKELYKKGGTQYDKTTDAGQGTSFWNGKKDTAKCKERQDKLLNLFAEKYRDQPAALTDPRCDFWR